MSLLLTSPLAASDSALVIREDIENRVARAGGERGSLSISLSWHTPDDLDLHLVTPGSRINYKAKQWRGGELDVDMCVHGRLHRGVGKALQVVETAARLFHSHAHSHRSSASRCGEHPVENIVFKKRPPNGVYEVQVQLFKLHSMSARRYLAGADRERIGFEVLVAHGDKHELFTGLCTPAKLRKRTPVAAPTKVFRFSIHDGVLSPIGRARPNPECRLARLAPPPRRDGLLEQAARRFLGLGKEEL